MKMTKTIYNTSYIIYKHTNIVNGKSYIGQTIKGIDYRWKQHCNPSRNVYHFQRAIQKYGIDNWDHEILYISFYLDQEHLDDVEKSLIIDHDTYNNGYNSTIGGSHQIGTDNYFSYAKLGEEGMKAKSAKVSSTRKLLGIAKGQSNNCSSSNMSSEKLSEKNSKSALTRNGKTYIIVSPEGKEYRVFGTIKNHLMKLLNTLGITVSPRKYINKGIVPTRSKPQNNSALVDWEIYTI